MFLRTVKNYYINYHYTGILDITCIMSIAQTSEKYRKVASRSTSRLVARPRIFRLFMKGKFDPYVL